MNSAIAISIAFVLQIAVVGADSEKTDLGAERAAAIKADVENFRLDLSYVGESDKPYYALMLSVPPVEAERTSSFSFAQQIDEEQARKIIDHLVAMQTFGRAQNADAIRKMPAGPLYLLRLRGGDLHLAENLGWSRDMLTRLDGLREVLDGDAQKAMDMLLARLSGHRREWEANMFQATVRRADSRIRFSTERGITVFDITSSFGIDRATVKRSTETWPMSIVVRLHLRGLESLKIGNGSETIDVSVSSTGDRGTSISLRKGESESIVSRDSPFWTDARIVGEEKTIPLKDGFFEVPLPATMLEQNPETITLEWIDFYRN